MSPLPPPTVPALDNTDPTLQKEAQVPKPFPSFYMRELNQELLVGYDTPAGKELFKQALNEGGLEAFFPLSQQFLTQEEPAYCGIGTLCMILNALKIDPAKTWRKPWRWFTQEMLDCCRPLEYVRENGITLSEFSCLARCNGLSATTKHADQISLEEFRRDIIASTSSAEQLMAVSYSRATLGQTGSGHFSPVGGYSSKDGGKVLILDVARFKYPSYWVPLELLYQSLIPQDPLTKQPRGYSILFRPAFADPSSSLLRLNFTKASWPLFFRRITEPCRPADSLDSLVWILADAIQGTLTESSIFPVVDRHEELRAKVNKQPLSPTSLNALGQTQTLSPSDMASYDPAQAHHTAREYTAALASFNAHLSSRSALYNLITSNPSRPESKILTPSTHPPLTVFILSLLSSPPFLKQLQSDALRMQIEERIRDDLRDGRIRREVEIIRRQMESLETCCKEECGPTCRVEGGCAK